MLYRPTFQHFLMGIARLRPEYRKDETDAGTNMRLETLRGREGLATVTDVLTEATTLYEAMSEASFLGPVEVVFVNDDGTSTRRILFEKKGS